MCRQNITHFWFLNVLRVFQCVNFIWGVHMPNENLFIREINRVYTKGYLRCVQVVPMKQQWIQKLHTILLQYEWKIARIYSFLVARICFLRCDFSPLYGENGDCIATQPTLYDGIHFHVMFMVKTASEYKIGSIKTCSLRCNASNVILVKFLFETI